MTKQRRHLDGQRRGDGKAEDDEQLGVCGIRRLARQRVKMAHALDRDHESFIRRQTGLGKSRELVAQMSLEFLDVRIVNGPPAAQGLTPLRDLLLERSIGEPRHTVHSFIEVSFGWLSTRETFDSTASSSGVMQPNCLARIMKFQSGSNFFQPEA